MLFDSMVDDVIKRSLVDANLEGSELTLERMAGLKELYDNVLKPIRAPSMSDRTIERRREAWTPVSFTAMLVDKIASLVYTRAVTRKLVDEAMNKALQEAYFMQDAVFLRVTKLASLGGFAAIRVRRKWDGTITLSCYEYSEIKPHLDPENRHGKPIGIVFSVLTSDLPPWAIDQVKKKDAGMYRFEEYISRHIRDDDGKILTYGKYRAWVDDKEITTPTNGINVLGDYLGAVYWRGLDHPFNAYGKSDVLPLYETLVSINELMTDGRENIMWNIHSPIITNASGNISWKMAPDSVIQLKNSGEEEAYAKRLPKGTDSINDFSVFLDILLKAFHQTSRIPSVSLGDTKGLGGAPSGIALEVAMTPAIELVAEKENTAIPQELILMEEILAKKAYYGDIKGKYTMRVEGYDMPDPLKINKIMEDAVVEFAPIELPREIQKETLSSQVKSGLKSQEQAVKELHPSWNEVAVEEEIEAINEPVAESDNLAKESLRLLNDNLNKKDEE
ncbi:MAG: hypothetical protein KAU20_03530 [Nanoarchaeota archaeon]|nr:hypothetical protein [Nanoarchaeota archaeon]